jgi:hypothetical protein
MRRVVNSLFIATIILVVAGNQPATRPGYRIARIQSADIRESSGVIESRRHPGVLWTHNDSGNAPEIFAIDRDGKLLAKFEIEAPNVDWEDIAADDGGALYIADIGNNTRNRRNVQVYQVDEPELPDTGQRSVGRPSEGRVGLTRKLKPVATYELSYPGEPFDAEAFFIAEEHGYIVEKRMDFQRARVFRFWLRSTEKSQELEFFCDLPVRAPVTGADRSANGRYVAIITVAGPVVLEVQGELMKLSTAAPNSIRFLAPKMEAGCFVKEGVLATTELGDILLFRWEWFDPPINLDR